VVGLDLSPGMIEQARRLLPQELAGRVRFEVGDASRLTFPDRFFDLVVLLNMIPFFDELARVTAPGGSIVFASSYGAETPIYVPPETIRERLGFERYDEVRVGEGTALIATRKG
jgi:ubiquinone/menaquinone biosynthesis C-methylase UbiE